MVPEKEQLLLSNNYFKCTAWFAAFAGTLALGVLQTKFAITWHNPYGIFVGVAGLIVSLLVAAVFWQRLQGRELLSYTRLGGYHGVDKVQQVITFTSASRLAKGALCVLGVYMALLVSIHIASPDPFNTKFPTGCPHMSSDMGCSRVAQFFSHNCGELQPLQLHTSLGTAHEQLSDYIHAQPRAKVIYSNPNFIHARFVSAFWGFADDLMVHLSCVHGTEQTRIELQGQLRIGKSDLGVNFKRISQLVGHFAAREAIGDLPIGSCQ